MGTPSPIAVHQPVRRLWMWLGIALLTGGCLGHLFAAQAIGGSWVAYRDHIVGFVGLTLVSGGILAALGRRFWRGRHDLTVFLLGIVQALIGLAVYVQRFSLKG